MIHAPENLLERAFLDSGERQEEGGEVEDLCGLLHHLEIFPWQMHCSHKNQSPTHETCYDEIHNPRRMGEQTQCTWCLPEMST